MNPLKKLWNITPTVIIGKKIHQSGALKREKKPKKEKPIKLQGIYYNSHPAIHGQTWLKLEMSNAGVAVYGAKKLLVRQFGWNEITGYDNEIEDKTQLQTTQRLTATRMATMGIFSLAAPKKSKSGSVKEKFYDVLHTTTGDIELELVIDSGSAGGSIGDLSRSMASLAIARREAKTNKIKRFVNEHATGKTPQS